MHNKISTLKYQRTGSQRDFCQQFCCWASFAPFFHWRKKVESVRNLSVLPVGNSVCYNSEILPWARTSLCLSCLLFWTLFLAYFNCINRQKLCRCDTRGKPPEWQYYLECNTLPPVNVAVTTEMQPSGWKDLFQFPWQVTGRWEVEKYHRMDPATKSNVTPLSLPFASHE